MIILNNYIIYEYINKITKDDIKNYFYKNSININSSDVNTIYEYIKKYYKNIFEIDSNFLLNELKNKLSNPVYKKIEELYYKYKEKISP